MSENDIAREVYQCALTVHRRLGAGLLESAYEECLAYEVAKSGLHYTLNDKKGYRSSMTR